MITFKEENRYFSEDCEHIIYECSFDKNYMLKDFLDELKQRTNDIEWIYTPSIDIIINGCITPLCDHDPVTQDWEFYDNYDWYDKIKDRVIQSVNPVHCVNVWMFIEVNLVEENDG